MENEEVVVSEEETLEEDPDSEVKEEAPKTKIKKPKRVRLKDRTSKNDIRYRGPLSYSSIRIIGWVFMIFSQLAVLFTFAMKISPDLSSSLTLPTEFFKYFRSFPVPLFLLANFAFILQGKADFRRLLVFYGGVAVLLYIAGIVLMSHFGLGFAYGVSPATFDFAEYASIFGTTLITSNNPSLYMLNIFIDLFLCALTYFFIHYKPTKYFQGKKLILFRLMVLIPILYEIGSILIKYMTLTERMTINYFVFYALTAKPPFMFISFILIILVTKLQEKSFMKRFKDEEALDDHLKTNAHSLNVSITIFWVFIVTAFLDLITMIGYCMSYILIKTTAEAELEARISESIKYAQSIGLGQSACLILVAPVALLFSYSRKPKHPEYDKFIPIIAILIIIVVYIEGMFRILTHRFTQFIDWLSKLLNDGGNI